MNTANDNEHLNHLPTVVVDLPLTCAEVYEILQLMGSRCLVEVRGPEAVYQWLWVLDSNGHLVMYIYNPYETFAGYLRWNTPEGPTKDVTDIFMDGDNYD